MIEEQDKSYTKKEIYKTLHPWVRQWFNEKEKGLNKSKEKIKRIKESLSIISKNKFRSV